MTAPATHSATMGNYYSLHAHSHFSTIDGIGTVQQMVNTAQEWGQKGLALTDHGNMSGAFQLYEACQKAAIKPFIGSEMYLVSDCSNKDAKRYHVGIAALNEQGYKTLVALSTRSHLRSRFHRKPRIDLQDLRDLADAGLTKDLVLTTGCFFGLAIQTLVTPLPYEGVDGEPLPGTEVNAYSIAAGYEKMLEVLDLYGTWFPHTYVEIQHHRTPTDANGVNENMLVRQMWDAAQELELPVVITNDSHYCSSQDRVLHNLMKKVGYYGSAGSSDDGDGNKVEKDWTFPGDSYHLASEQWVYTQHYQGQHDDIWEAAQNSYQELLQLNQMTLAPIDKYSYHIPRIVPDPQRHVQKLCAAALKEKEKEKKLTNGSKKRVYRDQLQHELQIIADLGMADYFCLVLDYCQEARRRGIFINARGSANGSLVCWLLGITSTDPIRWGLTFERFLSHDRTKPPDIDIDIDKFRRAELIDYIASRFRITPIGTYSRLGLTNDPEGEEAIGAGSLWVLWMAKQRQELGSAAYNKKYGTLRGLYDLEKTKPVQAARLKRLAAMDVYKSAGTHAAGYLVSAESQPIGEYMPTMLIPSSNTQVTQMMMGDCEDAGYIKIDLLGLRSLATVYETLVLLNKDPLAGLDWIPLNNSRVFTLLRQGRTDTGVFQFEGWTSAKGCREVRVKNVQDLILVNALYRPAVISTGGVKTYLKNRAYPAAIKWLHPILEQELADTYGVAVYQEQVMAVLRAVGMPIAELNQLLKAIKASQSAAMDKAAITFGNIYTLFVDLAHQAGMSDAAVQQVWDMMAGYAEYAFNKAHSTGYAILGYQMAYLKVQHPLEFHTALLNTISRAGDAKKELRYAAETRRMHIEILPPSINGSELGYSIDDYSPDHPAIRRGLISIKGIGYAVGEAIADSREHEGLFINTTDMVMKASEYLGRVIPGGKQWIGARERNGAIAALYEAGTLDELREADRKVNEVTDTNDHKIVVKGSGVKISARG